MSVSTHPWWGLRPAAPCVDLWSIISTLGGAERAAGASASEWAAAGLPLPWVSKLAAEPPPGRWIVPTDPGWPSVLCGVPFAPVALQLEGQASLLGDAAVAVVGARACTPRGRQWARSVAEDLVAAGAVVISGLARGIDAEAHLAAPGRTIAVLGQGLFAPMPLWQREVRAKLVLAGGLVLSEFAPAMPGSTFTFPVRNRIIAGLSRGVVVVEAASRSGARNTASHAIRAGREVWAIPGPPDAPASAGCLDLIEEGVSVYRSSGEVVTRLGIGAPEPLGTLLRTPRTVAELAAATGWSTLRVVELVGGLEMQGRLARMPGPRYAWRDARSSRSP